MTAFRHLAWCAALAVAFVVAGCDVDPYCVTCGDDLDGGAPDGSADGSLDAFRPDAPFVPDTGPADGGPADGCLEVEICNGLDDDCDGEIDEGFDLMRDPEHCGGCDNYCGPPHSFPVCTDGVCGISGCDVGWHDLDGELENGCEYRCIETAEDDSICDLQDNDCDGEIDEDVDFDNDITNCGICGRVCGFARAAATCESGVCTLGDCDLNFHSVDGRDDNGCEYACTFESEVESCNLNDDNCDGRIDEGDPGGGVACGTDVGACSTGTTSCVGGTIQCSGAVAPTTELCNGIDDDCDGEIDEGNPEGGRLCGTRTGTCEQGREQCVGGALVCVGAIGPTTELCDGLDNDCDGTIDNGNPEGGASCGTDVGECTFGTMTCAGGTLLCIGGTGPVAELCDGLDNDCDGLVDEGNPEGGGLCGTDVGACAPGVYQCNAATGTLECIGAVGPGPELCDGLDNDCDGVIDNGNPEGGAPCGTDTGACTFGAMTCSGGALVCTGGTGPTVELCDGIDNDCDGLVDEDFDFATSVLHCGGCGNTCPGVLNATRACSSGTCDYVSCNPGFVDLDGIRSNGCEYACDFAGAEICNGRDDDCDGLVDEGVVAPSNFCNPNGVCAGTVATCGGTAGWTCNYTSPYYEESEVSCDGRDNDCDGAIDEPFTLRGTSCTNGELGGCLRTGVYVCNAAGDGVRCNAPASPGGTAETCNGVDDDCNGLVDDGMTPAIIPTVPVPRSGGGTVHVMRYEASRPDATSTGAGTLSTHACSDPNTIPWTTVTWTQAQAACCALNAGGTCAGDGSGWRLCDSGDWQTACEGPAGACTWSYATSCGSSQHATCNGKEHDCDPATAIDDDCLYPTGSAAFPMCRTDWGAGGSVYDMSGNAREWTATSRGSNLYEVRGGAYTNIEAGRTCQFDFTVAVNDFQHPNTGFRCCFY